MNSVEFIGRLTRPAPWRAYDSEPEQSYPESSQSPWPPPYRYGLPTIALAAAITATTSGGAPAGAIAFPSAPSVAVAPVGAATGVAPPVVCSVEELGSTWPRSVAASWRVITPSTGSAARRSQRRTLLRVPRPYWPSTVVASPYFVRKPCS